MGFLHAAGRARPRRGGGRTFRAPRREAATPPAAYSTAQPLAGGGSAKQTGAPLQGPALTQPRRAALDQSSRGPRGDHRAGHAGEEELGLVFARPALVAVVPGEAGDDDGAGGAVDEGDVVAHVVEAADLVADRRRDLGCVGGLEEPRDHVAALLVDQDLQHPPAQAAVAQLAAL